MISIDSFAFNDFGSKPTEQCLVFVWSAFETANVAIECDVNWSGAALKETPLDSRIKLQA